MICCFRNSLCFQSLLLGCVRNLWVLTVLCLSYFRFCVFYHSFVKKWVVRSGKALRKALATKHPQLKVSRSLTATTLESSLFDIGQRCGAAKSSGIRNLG
ncbi:hypothetical protein DVH24_016570 [Malus domestica]|uniref:Uncharacterized protein n=1 Tax=Malus domestica TaxID=3750 RepID=A0A498HQC7_MALDO|nr:hypothetical protein DVH24_016570 [Malus domestica]